jgi:hypothetical protein
MEPNTKTCWGLLRRRQCLVPTLRAWLLLALSTAVLAGTIVFGIAPFLALNDPVQADVLVVEGWVPDHVLQAAIAEFRQNHYAKLLVTGIPLEQGAPLSEYSNFANLGAAVLMKLGMSTNEVAAVPAPLAERDRTYSMALCLKAWLREHQMPHAKVNVLTQGPHARRSWLMFKKALGPDFTVGVIAIPARGYDARNWWRTSQGVRIVISETIGYIYARFFFHPREQ